MKDFKWRKSDGDWLLFHKSSSFYIAIIHNDFKNGQYYVDVYFDPELREEFLEDDLDVAKLKAEIKAVELRKAKRESLLKKASSKIQKRASVEKDLDVAKLKAEIKAVEFLKKEKIILD